VSVTQSAERLARDYLQTVRSDGTAASLRVRLAALDPDALTRELVDDARRKAFWLNVYNGAVRELLASDPGRYDSRIRFFYARQVPVAGRQLSLNRIEHGVLRRSMLSFGLGYLPNPVPSRFERRHRVDRLDPRIHFALNCGATSCPPIRSYEAGRIDEQLALASEAYLESTVTYDPERDVVEIPRLFRWYRGDFGGRDGILTFLSEHGPLSPGDAPRLAYSDYDWTLDVRTATP
jgi:hypothetical protein